MYETMMSRAEFEALPVEQQNKCYRVTGCIFI